MVTTRSRVKREAASATAPTATEISDLPAPEPIKQRKRKNSAASSASSSISSSSTLTPPSKLAKTDLALEELPPAPAPTPVTQLTQPPLAETVVTQPVDVAAAATVAAAELSVEDLADTNARSMTKSQAEAPAPVAAAQEMEELPLEASSAVPATTLPNTQVPTMMMSTTTVPDISALESVKEPVPEAKPLPEVATVLTQPPAAATVTTITPAIAAAPTAMDFDSTTTTENVPPAPTAPQISAITAPAPVPASIAPVLSFGSTVPLSNAALTNTLVAAPATLSATDKPLPPTPLETPYMATNMMAVDPTSLLLDPNAGLPDRSSTMTATTTPASVAMLPAMTVTTVGTLPYQLQATGTKDMNGSAVDIALVTNDFQPQLMPQQQVNRSGKLLPVMSGTDSPGIGSAKGPSQSGV